MHSPLKYSIACNRACSAFIRGFQSENYSLYILRKISLLISVEMLQEFIILKGGRKKYFYIGTFEVCHKTSIELFKIG